MTNSKKYLYKIPDDSNHVATKITAWINNGQEILEIGCASGIQTRHFRERLGCRVTGIEIDPLAAEDARPYCENLIIGSIEELDLPKALGDKLFDVIILADVLEHLIDPAKALIKVRPFLKKEGSLIASIPNIAHAAICWELAHGRFDYHKFGLLDDTHIRFFTKKSIIHLFERSGFYISAWERIIKRPKETEFVVHPLSAEESAFLAWIEAQNPEAHTYQFVVKTHSTEHRGMFESDLHTAKAEIQHLKQYNKQLVSQIDWLEGHRFGVLTPLLECLRQWFWSTKKK